MDEANYKIEDAGRAAIRDGSIEKYLEKINEEKSKMDDLKVLQERSLREGIRHSEKMLRIAEEANEIAKSANISE